MNSSPYKGFSSFSMSFVLLLNMFLSLRLRKWKFVQFEACESGDENGIARSFVYISTGRN